MNVFLPYKSFDECAKVLDDKRLTKQILECMQIIRMVERHLEDSSYVNPYLHHPVVRWYAFQLKHIVDYALAMCREFHYRFNKSHVYHIDFIHKMRPFESDFKPFFASGSRNAPNSVRETEPDKVYELFKKRLAEKWKSDTEKGNRPKWTNRNIPNFYLGGTI